MAQGGAWLERTWKKDASKHPYKNKRQAIEV